MKKLILILLSVLFIGFSFSSELYIYPSTGNVSKNCVESFDIKMNANGQQIISTDLQIETSMDFVDFVPNLSSFKYFAPINISNGLMKVMGFSIDEGDAILSDDVTIGTLYVKETSSNLDSFIRLRFNGTGHTTDSNLAYGGVDYLDNVKNGFYMVGGEECVDDAVISGGIMNLNNNEQMQKLLKSIEEDNKAFLNFSFFVKNWYFVLLFVFLLVLGIVYFSKVKGKSFDLN